MHSQESSSYQNMAIEPYSVKCHPKTRLFGEQNFSKQQAISLNSWYLSFGRGSHNSTLKPLNHLSEIPQIYGYQEKISSSVSTTRKTAAPALYVDT